MGYPVELGLSTAAGIKESKDDLGTGIQRLGKNDVREILIAG